MMRFHILIPFLAVSVMLAGCVSNDSAWVKDDTLRSETGQALADCKYQAKVATIGIGANDHPKTWGAAIGDGIGDAVIQTMDEEELINSCMQAKGFRQ